MRDLYINGCWGSSVEFFATLIVPNLEGLVVVADIEYEENWPVSWSTLQSFQRRSRFDLMALNLHEPLDLITPEELLILIAMSPSLAHLYLGEQFYYQIIPEFLKLLIYDPDKPQHDVIAPKLKSLMLMCHDKEYWDGDEVDPEERAATVRRHIIAMVKSRWHPHVEMEKSGIACFQSLTLLRPSRSSVAIISEALRDICDQGFSFTFRIF